MSGPILRFNDTELDVGRYELRRNGALLRLERLPMELLILLASRKGELVTRGEVIDRLWGKEVYLDVDQGINTAIRKIRICLRDTTESPKYIQTVVGKGYRFVPPVTILEPSTADSAQGAATPAAPPVVAPIPAPPRRAFRVSSFGPRTAIAGAAMAVIVALAITYTMVKSRPTNAMAPKVKSLAVLPFENLSGDPGQDYLADGVTDDLITMLAKNSELRIVSRTSIMRYKKVRRPLSDIARELGADGILEGSTGRFGSRLNINVQLIYAPTDTHVWTESYDRDVSDALALQAELAQTIARQVGIAASTPSHPSKAINSEAHDNYQMGRYYWFTGDYEKSREHFQKAIGLQPDYAAAWSGIADSYIAAAVGGESHVAKAVANGEPAAEKALALDDSVAEAHVTMAAVYYFLRWDLPGADRESQRAIEINPRLAQARHLRALILQTLGRTDEALQQQKEAMELDPFAQPGALALALIHARKFDAAINEARQRSEAQPDNAELHEMLHYAYMHSGMEKEAAEQWEVELQLSGNKESALAVRQAFTRGGLKAVHEWELSGLIEEARKGYVSQLDLASVYAHLRRKEEALRCLELAYEEREPWMVQLENMPSFDFMHSEPRYQAIVRKMELPGGLVK